MAKGEDDWKLRLDAFKRKVAAQAPKILTVQLHGWELHMGYRETEAEPWALTAHPATQRPDYAWVGQAAEHLGAPADEKPEPPKKGAPAIVSWTWTAPAMKVWKGTT